MKLTQQGINSWLTEFCLQVYAGALLPSGVSNTNKSLMHILHVLHASSEWAGAIVTPWNSGRSEFSEVTYFKLNLYLCLLRFGASFSLSWFWNPPLPSALPPPSKVISHKDCCQNGKMSPSHHYKSVPTGCSLATKSHTLSTFLAVSLLLYHPNSSSYKLPVLNADTARWKSSGSI